jgi:hypothetical protein
MIEDEGDESRRGNHESVERSGEKAHVAFGFLNFRRERAGVASVSRVHSHLAVVEEVRRLSDLGKDLLVVPPIKHENLFGTVQAQPDKRPTWVGEHVVGPQIPAILRALGLLGAQVLSRALRTLGLAR